MTKRLLMAAAILLVACSGTGKKQIGIDSGSEDLSVAADVTGGDAGLAQEDLTAPEDLAPSEDVAEGEATAELVEPADVAEEVEPSDVAEEVEPSDVAEEVEPSDVAEEVEPSDVVEPLPGCCFADDDCPEGKVCIDEGGDGTGMCKAQPEPDKCWHDEHCKPGQACKGAFVCPCDSDCDGADIAGECVYLCGDDDCCCVDSDCNQGNVCAILENGNNCLPAQPEGMCWQDSDCGEYEYCQGAVACPCQWDCDGDGWDIPGTCMPTGGDMCCMTDADCPQFFMGEPMICLIQEGNPFVVGTCQQAAPEGKCWSEADCIPGEACHELYFCPCGMDCQAPGTQMGDCVSPAHMDPACLPDGAECGTATGTSWLVFPDPWMGDEPAPPQQPLADVAIEAYSAEQIVAKTATGPEGNYLLTLAPGEYTLRALHTFVSEWESVFPDVIEKSITVTAEEATITDFEFQWEGDTVDKPNIYLYPESTHEVSVTLEFKGNMLVKSIPDYGDGWTVTASPDGLIDGSYGFLFYEATAGGAGFQTDEGFSVSQTDLPQWMESTLYAYGFNGQETADFVEFWLAALPAAPWYLFYPQTEEIVDQHVGLQVEPTPDSLLRLWFAVQPVVVPVVLATPEVVPFNRLGFAVTEWGVIVLD